MSSPLSPVIADLVLQDLEMLALKNFLFNLLFCYHYVDDIILTAPSNFSDSILQTFNSQHNRVQLTLETERDKNLLFRRHIHK